MAWDYRGWDHEPRFNLVQNPLQLRLRGLPGYQVLRDGIDALCKYRAYLDPDPKAVIRLWGYVP